MWIESGPLAGHDVKTGGLFQCIDLRCLEGKSARKRLLKPRDIGGCCRFSFSQFGNWWNVGNLADTLQIWDTIGWHAICVNHLKVRMSYLAKRVPDPICKLKLKDYFPLKAILTCYFPVKALLWPVDDTVRNRRMDPEFHSKRIAKQLPAGSPWKPSSTPWNRGGEIPGLAMELEFAGRIMELNGSKIDLKSISNGSKMDQKWI